MPIDHKDEYATLRQETLDRFGRIHDTSKYGVAGFVAVLGYYYSHNELDHTLILFVLQLLVSLIGLSALSQYHGIYRLSTYIAVISEKDSKARWHRMIRSYEDYSLQCKLTSGIKWGTDCVMLSCLIFSLSIIGLGVTFLKAGYTEFIPLDKTLKFLFFLLCCIIFTGNIFIGYFLGWRGTKNFRKKTEKEWKQYCIDFGTEKFPDPYE
ncbi:MAG: hypothetical protein ACE5J5_08370 [Candidatus Hydrothermarchaeales archaeon]